MQDNSSTARDGLSMCKNKRLRASEKDRKLKFGGLEKRESKTKDDLKEMIKKRFKRFKFTS